MQVRVPQLFLLSETGRPLRSSHPASAAATSPDLLTSFRAVMTTMTIRTPGCPAAIQLATLDRPTSEAGAICDQPTEESTEMDETTRAAFERLLDLARSDTGQARRVANFILAWWNAESLGGFDIADLFALDAAIAGDMATVFGWIARRSNASYPEEYRLEIEGLIEAWRPDVWARSTESRLG